MASYNPDGPRRGVSWGVSYEGSRDGFSDRLMGLLTHGNAVP